MSIIQRSLCLITIILSLVALTVSSRAFAQTIPDPDVGVLIADKTFWAEFLPERYYFGRDGTFLLQYTAAAEPYKAGMVREGMWHKGEENSLCWTLKDNDTQHCYKVGENLTAPRPWYGFDNTYELQEIGYAASISWNRWIHGNLITKPAIYEAIAQGQLPPLDEKAYVADISGKMMRLPMSLVYHREDSRAYWVDEKTAKEITSNARMADSPAVASRTSTVKGTWGIQEGRHCYDWEGNYFRTCITVFSAKNLYVPQEGWVQIMDDNFIRLIKPSDLKLVK